MKAVLLLKTLAPITHGAETSGNESIIRREAVNTPVGVRHIPVITGNSLRHRLLREPHANVVSQDGGYSKEQIRWLYNGGALDGKHDGIDIRRVNQARELLPHVEALGCSLADTIVAGKLDMGVAWLACSETAEIVQAIIPGEWGAFPQLSPHSEFLSRNQYYKHDAAHSLASTNDERIKFEGMPHGGEHVVPNAAFVLSINADMLSELGRSAVMYGIEEWAAAGATIGGQASRGHGVVEPWLWTDGDDSSVLYRSHLENRLPEMRAFVRTLYK